MLMCCPLLRLLKSCINSILNWWLNNYLVFGDNWFSIQWQKRDIFIFYIIFFFSYFDKQQQQKQNFFNNMH